MKICKRCDTKKSLDKFGPDKRTPDGRQYTCRECVAKKVAHIRNVLGRKQYPSESESQKIYQLRSRYKMTDEEIEIHLSLTNCQSCGREMKVVADHCHTSGKYRGSICQPCNKIVGICGEDIEVLKSIITYIESW